MVLKTYLVRCTAAVDKYKSILRNDSLGSNVVVEKEVIFHPSKIESEKRYAVMFLSHKNVHKNLTKQKPLFTDFSKTLRPILMEFSEVCFNSP